VLFVFFVVKNPGLLRGLNKTEDREIFLRTQSTVVKAAELESGSLCGSSGGTPPCTAHPRCLPLERFQFQKDLFTTVIANMLHLRSEQASLQLFQIPHEK